MKNIALEFRAREFESVVGQQKIAVAIKNKIKTNSLSNVILLRGPTGTGKTTLAFLIAQALNCQNPKPDGNPCQQCSSCKSIASQSFVRDVVFFDSSILSGKADVLDLFSLVDTPPFFDKNKIFIIEEADQLSEAAKNSFLKIFEKDLKNKYFILLSMKHHGIPDAIKTRCQTYNLTPIPLAELMIAMKKVMEELGYWDTEEIPQNFKIKGLGTIASLAKGSLREAMQLLERCLTEGIYAPEDIKSLAIPASEQTAINVVWKILHKDKTFVEDIFLQSDYYSFFALLITFVQKALVYAQTGVSESESDYFNRQLAEVSAYGKELEMIAQACTPIFIQGNLTQKVMLYQMVLNLLRVVHTPDSTTIRQR